MAPEVGSPQGYDFPADVYSFAILLWQILTTKIPFEAELSSTTQDPAKLIKERRPSLKYIENAQIQALLEACWAANPDDRPTFTEIRKRVRDIADNSIVLPLPRKEKKKNATNKPRRRLRGSMFTR